MPRPEGRLNLLELQGRVLTGVHLSPEGGQWGFGFGDDCGLNLVCAWRIVTEDRVALAAQDHHQLFGLKEPVDGIAEAMRLLGNKRVVRASLSRYGDLLVEFEGGYRLETFTDSCGYESGTISFGGRQLIVMGGGEVAEFGVPEKDAQQ